MNEIFEKIHIIIAVFAALISTIYCILFYQGLTKTAICIIVTIIIFFVLGSMAKNYLINMFSGDKSHVQEENTESQEKVIEENEDNKENNIAQV